MNNNQTFLEILTILEMIVVIKKYSKLDLSTFKRKNKQSLFN